MNNKGLKLLENLLMFDDNKNHYSNVERVEILKNFRSKKLITFKERL